MAGEPRPNRPKALKRSAASLYRYMTPLRRFISQSQLVTTTYEINKTSLSIVGSCPLMAFSFLLIVGVFT